MKNWRDIILQSFGEPVSVLSLVADPDGLFCDEVLLRELNTKGIEVVEYKEAVSFRFIYETKYRQAVVGNKSNLIVRVESDLLENLPFDILQLGERFEFDLGSIFPRLSSVIVRSLGKSELDSLCEVYDSYGSDSEADTLRFILAKVYKIQTDVITDSTDLIKMLLSKHYGDRHYSQLIENYLIDQLNKIPRLEKLLIPELVKSQEVFYRYLHDEWKEFIDSITNKRLEVKELQDITADDASTCPFYDGDVRRLLDTLFTEGKMEALKGYNKGDLPSWTHFGVVINPMGDERIRVMDMIFHLSEKLHENNNYKDWINTAFLFGQIKFKSIIVGNGGDEELNNNIVQLQEQVDRLFTKWLTSNYNTLMNMPYLPEPVMLQHIPHYLSYCMKKEEKKVALLVLDGMSMLQWWQIRDSLKKDCDFEEKGAYAWIPTITSISRQSIFVGEMPAYYAASINTTSKEEKQWQLFWENHGILKAYVGYEKITASKQSYNIESINKPTNKVVAVVIDVIDTFIHSATQGYKGLYAETKIWLDGGYLKGLISQLVNCGYQVYLASDHGNRECVGIGRVSEGVLPQTKGQRARIYSSNILRDRAAMEYSSIPWDNGGLPDGFYPLLAQNNEAFITKNERVISHGGMSMEEVIVPFIKIRNDK